MPRSHRTLVFRRFISEYVDATLRAHGFRRKSLVWNRTVGEFVQAIGVQRSRHEIPDEILFYVNVGIHSSAVWRILYDDPAPDPVFAAPVDVQAHKRFGPPGERGGPWNLVPESNERALGDALAAVLRDQILPWLEGLSSLKGLRVHLVDWDAQQVPHSVGPDPAFIAVAGLLGNAERVEHLVNETLSRYVKRVAHLEAERMAHYEELIRRYQDGDVYAEQQLFVAEAMIKPPLPMPRHDPRPMLRSIVERLGLDPSVVDASDILST
jgi:hypothetical protein